MAGLFRFRCLNSLVAQIATVDSIKVRHSGDALQKVVDATYRVLGEANTVLAAPRDWSCIAPYDAKAALAASAHALRFGDTARFGRPSSRRSCHAAPRRRPRQRPLDGNELRSRHDARRVSARAPATMDQHGHWRRWRLVTTRAVSNIDQDVKLNRALWVSASAWRTRSDWPRSSASLSRAARVMTSPSIGRQHGTRQRSFFFANILRRRRALTMMRAAED